MPQGSLGEVLEKLGPVHHPDLLAGHGGFEDAGVFRLDAERALVLTIDFFAPIVDDPRWFGRIAAANSLSDVYAMGGYPVTALNVVGWPEELDMEVLGEVLAGGREKVEEAGAVLAGGHSVRDHEVKYGLAVTGMVHPDRFWRNSGAREGDLLVLSKPLGMGPISTAIKKGKAPAAMEQAAMETMATLNKAAAEAVADLDIHGATDVTGFGLMGHGFEMAEGAGLVLEVEAAAVPLLDGVEELARDGLLSGGCKRGREYLGDRVQVRESADAVRAQVFFDAETSGGLLLAVAEENGEAAVQRLRDAGAERAAVIGRFSVRVEGGPLVMVR